MTAVALVTGANRGLGRSTALALAAAGVDLIITYRSHAEEGAEVVSAAAALGRQAYALPLDAGRVDTFAAFVSGVRRVLQDGWGRETFDHLVNNAGTGSAAPFAETTEAAFDELLNVHFKGVYFLTQRLLPLLADGGRVINLSTGLTRFTSAGGMSAYASMKGAVEVLTRYLAAELGPRGITVNTVAPGPIGTDFGGGLVRDNEQFRTMLAGQAALGRVGEPDDIGSLIASLLTGGTGWVTGQRIEASGGTLL